MLAPGRPTENGAMESINGWVKEELLRDFMIDELDTFEKILEKYIYYFCCIHIAIPPLKTYIILA